MKKKPKHAVIQKIRYGVRKGKKPQVFEGGWVKNSPHKENTVYLQIPPDFVFDFTDDEAMAIISVLSFALWRRNCPLKVESRNKIKWHEKKLKYY